MADNSLTKFWRELKRRKVVRVLVVYAIVAWVAIEVSSVLFPALLLPDWTSRLVVALVLVGFPVAVGMAWAFQITPEGLRKEDFQGETGQATGNRTTEENPEPTGEDRLDGWKRIAAHLNRDVRTLRRWENGEDLPVRRLMHDKQATVYAYRSELDAWLKHRHQVASESSPTEISQKWKKSGRRVILPGAIVVVIGSLLSWYWPSSADPAIAFGEWDWVLITQFDNRTGEDVLDGTLEYALERELANSAFVKVTPNGRINDVLRLMKLPQDTVIDVGIGREISLRDGAIQILIAGRIESLGDQYLLSIQLVNPSDSVTLASFSSEAVGQAQILSLVGELAREVRVALGEGLASITRSQEMLARVTTPSLAALRLFTQANKAMRGPERTQATAILEEAVRIDPDFASAHLLLVYVLQDRDDMVRANEHLQKAVELAENTSEQERLFILATYYFYYLEDYPKSIETYQLLARLYPGHNWANGNLGNIYEWMGMFEKAIHYKQLAADYAPNNPWSHKELTELAVAIGDQNTRDHHLQVLNSISELGDWLESRLRFFPQHEAWVNGEYVSVAESLEEMVSSRTPEDLVSDNLFYTHLRSLYFALGKLERLRELSALRPQLGWFEAVLDFDSGNSDTLRRYLENADSEYWNATLMALAGQTERAMNIVNDPGVEERAPRYYQIRMLKNLIRGQVALTEGRLEDAVRFLDDDSYLLNISNKPAHMFAMHALAEAYEGLGETDKAIETLEMARLQKLLTIYEFGGAWMWLRNQVLLYELYNVVGRTAAASDVAAELRDVLQLADRDHPFLMALEK
jgi:tetratricopeptide (TPR) repeat protein